MSTTQIHVEDGTIDVVTTSKGEFVYTCKDAAGKTIMTRKSARTYVAAAFFERSYSSADGSAPAIYPEKFYYGRLDLIGKGNSKVYFESIGRTQPVGQHQPGRTMTITRCIVFKVKL